MAKYDAEFKYQVVQAYLCDKGGFQSLSDKYGVKSKTSLRKWVKQYKEFGYEGLEIRRNKQQYSINFKLDVLNYYYQSGLGLEDVAIRFNIPNFGLISSWNNKFNTYGIDSLKPKGRGKLSMSKKSKSNKPAPKQRTREQQLEHENELLRAELAFIKKLRALGMPIPERLKNEKPESSTPSEENLD